MRYRTVLVDDEPLAIQRLERLLEKYHDSIDIVGTAHGGTEAIEIINKLRPDLVFLDIQMPELNGFEVLESLDHTPLVIFSTAYDKYALKAFEVNSVDYLLKPVDPGRLKKTVDKLQRLTNDGADEVRGQITRALESLRKPLPSRIQVKTGDRIKLIPLTEVVFFHASDKYVEVHTYDKTHLISKSLSRLENELPPEDFVRIHRSTIINMNYLDEITRGFGGSYYARMKNGEQSRLPVSRGYKSRLGLS